MIIFSYYLGLCTRPKWEHLAKNPSFYLFNKVMCTTWLCFYIRLTHKIPS